MADLRNAQQPSSGSSSPRKRPTSAVLKSFMRPTTASSSTASHQPKASDATGLPLVPALKSKDLAQQPMPTSRDQKVLGEIQQNRNASPQQSPRRQPARNDLKTPQKYTKIPWRPHAKAMSTDMTLPKPETPKEKENTTPPRSAATQGIETPIWAQFSSKAFNNEKSSQPTSPAKSNTHLNNNDTSIMERGRTKEISNRTNQLATSTPKSKVLDTVAMFNEKSGSRSPVKSAKALEELDAALEAVLTAQNIPQNIRENMRHVDARIKEDFIRNAATEPSSRSASSESPSKQKQQPSAAIGTARGKFATLIRGRSNSRGANDERRSQDEEPVSPTKRSRSKTRAWTFGKGEGSPSKRARSNSRPRSLMSLKNFSSSSVNSLGWEGGKEPKDQGVVVTRPEDFVKYLKEEQKYQNVEVGKVHKLRILLRNEAISWVDEFVIQNGMNVLVGLLQNILQIEWREEHEDLLLHEVLLCLKALCTTQKALDKLAEMESTFIPGLLQMLFDKDRKGPSEFNTRGTIITILFNHLAAARYQNLSARAKALLSYLSDPTPPEDETPVGFILEMQKRRPYQTWCKEISGVTKEVFWIFLHHQNLVPLTPVQDIPEDEAYIKRNFPRERPPVPAAPYVGGVEWEATNYLAIHLDLLNGLIASLETERERNQLREELRASGFEKLMGGSLRLCKEKFYGAVHDGLRTWVAAAAEDGWEVNDVRMGPPREQNSQSSPSKNQEQAPKLELPALKLDVGQAKETDDKGWL